MFLQRKLHSTVTAAFSAAFIAVTSPPSHAQDEPAPSQADRPPAEQTSPPQSLVVGGDVIRHDGIQNLVIAKDIRNYYAGYGGNCAIWNWNGGSAYSYVNPGSNCRTASMNGRTYSWTVFGDTDAFTVQTEAYWVRMRDGFSRWVSANTYTKIQDHENAHCYRQSGVVKCYVELG
jgi:surface antigen